MIPRTLSQAIREIVGKYPVISITGPRQSGKTTLCRDMFSSLPYANLEDPETRDFARTDPKGFLAQYPGGAVLDEIQRVPELTSAIQVAVDKPGFHGTVVLTGSQNFSVANTINQTLAGRTALFTLLPFSLEELQTANKSFSQDRLLRSGFYPRLHDKGIEPSRFYADYVASYLERDIRQLKLVKDLGLFQSFLRLCAGRSGGILNLQSISNDLGIATNTARDWLNLLEASYIVFRLPPFSRNVGKRLIKSSKLYFYDPGLASYLIGIEEDKHLSAHPLRGAIFETMIVSELVKFRLHRGKSNNLIFYRDSNGVEVDAVLPVGAEFIPIEIKAGKTLTPSFFEGLRRFEKSVGSCKASLLVYGGDNAMIRQGYHVTHPWDFSSTLSNLLAAP